MSPTTSLQLQSPKKIESIRRTISLFRQPRVEMSLTVLEELPNNNKGKEELPNNNKGKEELHKQEEKQQVLVEAVVLVLLLEDPQ
jgi:hypothetical protein